MASISKRGGRYRVRWREQNGRQVQRSCPTLRDAKALAREVESTLARGRDWRPHVATITLAGLIGAWLDRRTLWVEGSTLQLDERRVSIFIDFLLSSGHDDAVGPEVLSRSLLDRFYAHLRNDRKNSVRTANATIGGILAAWRWMSDHEDLRHGVPPAPLKYRLPRVAEAVTFAPTWAQVDTVIEELSHVEHHQRRAILQRYLGFRYGQVCKLRWEDFDLAGKTHGVPTVMLRPSLGKTSAERAGRVLPITQHLADAMAGWGPGEGFVVGPPGGAEPYHPLQLAWEKAKVPREVWAGRKTHAFRKAFRSGLKHLGADEMSLDFYVGHKGTLRNVYTDPRDLGLVDLVELIPAIGSTDSTKPRRLWGRESSEVA